MKMAQTGTAELLQLLNLFDEYAPPYIYVFRMFMCFDVSVFRMFMFFECLCVSNVYVFRMFMFRMFILSNVYVFKMFMFFECLCFSYNSKAIYIFKFLFCFTFETTFRAAQNYFDTFDSEEVQAVVI